MTQTVTRLLCFMPYCCSANILLMLPHTDLSSDYLLGPSEDSSAPGRRRKLMSASVVTVAKCVVPTFPFKCPAPVNNPSNGALVWVAAGSTPLNTISGFFNSFTLPATTLTRAQLAPNVRLVLGVRGVDAGYEPNVTSGNSTTQTGVGSLANSGNGDTMAAPSASSAIHTYWISKSYVAAPGATTVRVGWGALQEPASDMHRLQAVLSIRLEQSP